MATIVFCEDDPITQKLIRITMRSTRHTIHIAANGREGLVLIERERPAVVIADIAMPDCDGFELLATLNAQPTLAHIPVVFLSAFAQHEELEFAHAQGAQGYLIKPFSPADLRATIENILANQAVPQK